MGKSSITLRGDHAVLQTPEGKEVRLDLGELLERSVGGRDARGVRPAGVRLIASAGSITIWVHEIAPSVRQLRWIAASSPSPFGPGTRYRLVRLSLPYLIVLAVFQDGVLSDANECFFRVAPLEDERDELHYPALLNCSRFVPEAGRPLSWICTQHLDREPLLAEPDRRRRMRKGLDLLFKCLIDTGFNYSSESHEHSSWFTESRQVDARIATVERWQAASEESPLFALDVPWLKTGKTVEQVVDRIFANHGVRRRELSSDDLARIISHHGTSS